MPRAVQWPLPERGRGRARPRCRPLMSPANSQVDVVECGAWMQLQTRTGGREESMDTSSFLLSFPDRADAEEALNDNEQTVQGGMGDSECPPLAR